jgi:hypothetical protein
MRDLTLAAQRVTRNVGGTSGRKIKPVKCNGCLKDVSPSRRLKSGVPPTGGRIVRAVA